MTDSGATISKAIRTLFISSTDTKLSMTRQHKRMSRHLSLFQMEVYSVEERREEEEEEEEGRGGRGGEKRKRERSGVKRNLRRIPGIYTLFNISSKSG